MRPSPLLLKIAFVAFLISVLVVVLGRASIGVTLAVWGLLAFAVLADIISSRPRGKLSLNIEMPREAFSGEDIPVSFFVADSSGSAPPGLECRLRYPEGLDGPDTMAFAPVNNGSEVRFSLWGKRRGAWNFDRLWLFWPGRFGLVEFIPSLVIDQKLVIIPNIRPINSGQIDVLIRSNLFGIKENAMQGEGSDFHQLRDFTTGMDVRSIDWKRSASHRSLVAKEMRAERNHHIILALDNGYLMREEIAGLPKIDHQINAALAVAWAAVQGGDQIGMFAFDVKPRFYLPPEGGRTAFARLRTRAGELDYRSVETNHTLAAAFLQARLKRRSLIVIFSDFVDTTTAELLLENVSVLNKRHLIVFATLGDPELVELIQSAPNSLTDVARSVSAEQFLQERRVVLDRLRRLGVLCVEADPKKMTASLISTYLQIKAREMI